VNIKKYNMSEISGRKYFSIQFILNIIIMGILFKIYLDIKQQLNDAEIKILNLES
jgi:hypothetical protein